MNAQAANWRACEVAKARKRIQRGADIEAVLDGLSRGLTQKLLHGVFSELNTAAGEDRGPTARAFARAFLRLPQGLPQ